MSCFFQFFGHPCVSTTEKVRKLEIWGSDTWTSPCTWFAQTHVQWHVKTCCTSWPKNFSTRCRNELFVLQNEKADFTGKVGGSFYLHVGTTLLKLCLLKVKVMRWQEDIFAKLDAKTINVKNRRISFETVKTVFFTKVQTSNKFCG